MAPRLQRLAQFSRPRSFIADSQFLRHLHRHHPLRLQPPPAQVLQRGGVGHPGNPGAQRGFKTKALQLAEHGQEGFLQQVGHLIAVAHHAPDHMRAGALVGLDQLRKRRLRAVDDGPHQGLVRIQRCGGCRHRRCFVATTAPQCRQCFAEQAHLRGAPCARGMGRLSPCVRQDG